MLGELVARDDGFLVAEQVFEPFFTSHAAGTGLGLYLARELCEGNRVELSLLEHGAGGCVFRLLFPAQQSAQGWQAAS